MFSLKRVWHLTVYFEHLIFYFYCWIKMKVLLKHWLIKNENIFDVYIQVKESKRTHRFSVTLSFVPKRSSDRTFFWRSSVWRVLSDEFCLTSAFHKNQHLKYHAFQKPVNKTASRSIPESSIEIASFCSDFNARDILHFLLARERHRN